MPQLHALALAAFLALGAPAAAAAQAVAVGPQYDSVHVYVAPQDMDRFIASVIATFGGQTGRAASVTVTPTPSTTLSQIVFTPRGFLSVFGFKTPIPYPFGEERTGYLVQDMDAAVAKARAAGAEVVVAPFPDAIGRDAVIRWPGGVAMQLYWHTAPPSYAPLETVPENRVYVSAEAADVFVKDFLAFSGGRVVLDDPKAPGAEIGRPGIAYRRIRLESGFGKLTVLVTDGRLPWPYGREILGYEVEDLAATLAKATAAGVQVVTTPYTAAGRQAAMLRFPGDFIAEVHAPAP